MNGQGSGTAGGGGALGLYLRPTRRERMPATMIKMALAAMMLSLALPLTACDDKDSGSQVGERIDEGLKDGKRAIEDATD
jgi:hypothetical protein